MQPYWGLLGGSRARRCSRVRLDRCGPRAALEGSVALGACTQQRLGLTQCRFGGGGRAWANGWTDEMDGVGGVCVCLCVCVCACVRVWVMVGMVGVGVGVGVLRPRWVLRAAYLEGAPGRWSDSARRSAAAPRSALSYSTRPSV